MIVWSLIKNTIFAFIISLYFYKYFKFKKQFQEQIILSGIDSVITCYTEAVRIHDSIKEVENALEYFENEAYQHKSTIKAIRNKLEEYTIKMENNSLSYDDFEAFMISINKQLDYLQTRFNYDFWDYKAALDVKWIHKRLKMEKQKLQQLTSQLSILEKSIETLEFFGVIQPRPLLQSQDNEEASFANFISEFNYKNKGLTPNEAEILGSLIEKRKLNYDRSIRFRYSHLSKNNKFRLAQLEILTTDLKDEPLLHFFERIISSTHSKLLYSTNEADTSLKEAVVEYMNDILHSHKELYDLMTDMEIFRVKLH